MSDRKIIVVFVCGERFHNIICGHVLMEVRRNVFLMQWI